jgi:hypothetical protein
MLQNGAIKEDMDNMLGSFDYIETFSHLAFAEAKLLDPNKKEGIYFLCAALASLRLWITIDNPPY